MSSHKSRIFQRPLRGLASAALAGSIITLLSPELHAADSEKPLKPMPEGEMLEFPAWEPLFEPQQAPAAAPDSGLRSTSIRVERHGNEEEVVLAPPESLDEALRVASIQAGPPREKALTTVWRRYNTTILLRSLTARIESGAIEDAALAAETFLLGGELGRKHVTDLLSSATVRTGDRTAYALASAGPQAASIFGRGLNSADPNVQRRSAWGLGRVGGPESARLLGQLESHPDVHLRMVAVDALGVMSLEERAGQLPRFASDSHAAVRRRIAEIYAFSPAPEARAPLATLARDPESSVRVAAVVALSVRENGGIEGLSRALVDPLPALRAEAARGLASLLPDKDRARLLKHPDAVVRLAAFDQVVAHPDMGVSVYASLADDPDAMLRRRALERILVQQGNQAVDAALAYVADPDPQIELDVLAYVQRSGLAVAPSRYIPLAKHGHPAAQRKVVAQLIASNTPEAMETLRHFVGVADPHLRKMVIARLAERPDEASLVALQPLIRDEDPAIRRAALDALARMPFDEALDPLQAFLDDPEVSLRVAAADALGARKDPRAVMSLATHARDALPVRQAIVAALDKIGDDVAASALSEYMQDTQPELRLKALRALEKIGTPMAMGFVGEVFSSTDGALRGEAIQVLHRAAREQPEHAALVAQQLAHFLYDPDEGVRLAAITATGSTGHGEAVAGLMKLADDSEARVRRTAVAALQRVRDDKAIDGLQRFLADQDAEVRRGAYEGFAQVGGRRGFALLVNGLEDASDPVRISVARSVGELRLSAAVPKIQERLLLSSDIDEQRALIQALAKIPSQDAKQALVDISANGGVWQKVMAKKALDKVDLEEDDRREVESVLADSSDRE